MTFKLPISGDGSQSNPYRVEVDNESWTDNGDGTATVTLTDEAKTRLELARRAVKDNDQDAFIPASELTDGEVGLLVQEMNEVTPWEDIPVGNTISVDQLVSYNGTSLYRTLQQHDKQETWSPPTAVSLFAEEAPAGVIPAWQQPEGAHDAYDQGFLVEHNGKIWESDVDGNAWEPPEQWTDVTSQYS
jgi:hypothetical protein